MKILEVIPSISPALGGPTQVIFGLTKALRSAGVDAQVATTNDNILGYLDVPLAQKIEYEGIPVWFFPRFPLRMKEFLFSADISRWLWLNLRNYDLATAHYLFSYPPSCLATICRLQNIPYTVRTIGQLTPWALNQSALKKRIYTRLIEKQNLENAKFIHCTSTEEANDVRRFGIKTPRVVLPLGVDPPQLLSEAKSKLCHRYGIPDDIPVILFLSRLHPKKRPDWLIKTLGALARESHKFHLVVAGSGDEKYVESLHHLTADLNISNHVSFVGFAAGEDKDLLLQGSDLFVLPTYSENFGIVLAEAMVSGLPVITTSGAQIANEIAQAKAGIIADTDLELYSAIAQLLESSERRQELGDNGRQFALRRYSWSSIAREFVVVYESILRQETMPDPYIPMEITLDKTIR